MATGYKAGLNENVVREYVCCNSLMKFFHESLNGTGVRPRMPKKKSQSCSSQQDVGKRKSK